jgi:hypothetical protein
MRKCIFVLTLATAMLFIFVACGDNNSNQDTEDVYETSIDETQIENEDNNDDSYDWIDLGIISIPSTWSYVFVETIHGGYFSISGEGDYLGRVRMYAGAMDGPDLQWRIENSLSHTSFLFDDGYVGHMLEYDYSIDWLRGGWSFSLPHHGLRTPIFTDNEELILQVARSLTALPDRDNAGLITRPPINMYMDENIFDTLLDNTDNIHQFAFMQVEVGFYHTLVFTTEEMVYDFSFVVLDDDGGMSDIRIVDTPYTIPQFLPNEAFVLDFVFVHYLHPRGGIAYTDQQGIRHFYWIFEDMAGEPRPPFSLIHFESVAAGAGFDAREQQGQNPYVTQATSWQEAYAQYIRPLTTGLALHEWETNWEFALHDINHDGIPELFIGSRQISGHMNFRYVYTFSHSAGGAVRLDFHDFLTDGGIFTPMDNSPWIIAFLAAGSGGRYVRLEMTELRLVPTVEGTAFMNDEGHEMMGEENFDWQSYEWYDLTIDGVEVTYEEFVNTFGTHEERAWLNFNEVNNDNIMRIIWGTAQ